MILTDLGGTKYTVHISYDPPTFNRVTFCKLHLGPCIQDEPNPECKSVGHLGMAVCSAHDEFRKIIGRKLALARAMLAMGLSSGIRTQLWADFGRQAKLF
jgi:hypothetical protein